MARLKAGTTVQARLKAGTTRRREASCDPVVPAFRRAVNLAR